jgi:transposase
MNLRKFELDSRFVGAMPLVNHYLAKIGLHRYMDKHLPTPDHRTALAPSVVLGVIVRNLVVARAPLYSLREWADDKVPGLLGLAADQVRLLNDDRMGRALDTLFEADRAAILTDIMVNVVRVFGLSLEQFNNDSTSLTVYGQYRKATGKTRRGKPTLAITFGHNKDHRPDLKQLVLILTTSSDGTVPVHFKVADGNTEDSTTHIETWEHIRTLVGSADFLYVADSKLCTRANLKYINQRHGRFVTIMPRSRKEDKQFKDWLQGNEPEWVEIARKPNARMKDGPPDVIWSIPSPIADPDAFRVAWYLSSHKQERDSLWRRNAIQTAIVELGKLKRRLDAPRPRFKSESAVYAAAEAIVKKCRAERWIELNVETVAETEYRQERRGRPGNDTRFRRVQRRRFTLTWKTLDERVAYDARCDGVFPLITNAPEKDLSALQMFDAYKSKQPALERRHHLFKNVEASAPVLLKSVTRIEALVFLLFVALLVHALLERDLRSALQTDGSGPLPLYPEDRACKAPTTARVIEVFEGLQRHLLTQADETVQRFDPELSSLQRRVLRALGIRAASFHGQ